ncbi:MAG: ABC transporter substrate-binding protein [Thermotogae bacterium]|jgi:peptide/nickel transport system substrate-binding protein|nr:ABC transporter substrate-binding protein [Thermotogota bacterium]MCL5031823.1 ABC transporter substrate-binding protein [Thermotogota bacterium]
MKKLLIFVLVSALIVAGLSAFGQEFANIFPPVSNVKYGGTLRVVTTWGPVAFNLNPFQPSGQSLGMGPVMYGTLFLVQPYNGAMTPFFGTNYEWSNNNLVLTVTIRQGLKWSDGQPFTPEDVAFTFNYLKKYPALDTNGIWSSISNLQSVAASGNNVIFTFSKPNTPLLIQIAQISIVPEHIWSSITDPTKFLNQDPVVAGPFLYVKGSYNSANYTFELVKNPNFFMNTPEFGNRPFIDKIEVRSLIGGQPLQYLLRGDADWSYYGSGIDPYTLWYNRNPATNKFWWPTSNGNLLYLNTQKYPFNNVAFRKAVSMAIDRKSLEDKAYFGTGGYTQNPTGIIPAQQAEWLDPTLTALASSLNSFNVPEAQKILAAAGFTKNAQGQLCGPDGKPLPTFKILVGAGWGDFITMAQIITSNLSQLGITTVTDQEPWDTYISSVMTGTYEMVISWETGSGPSPYYLYYYEFNPAFSATTIGQNASSGWSRYTNPLITDALQTYAQTSDLSLQKQAMATIERIVLQDVPYIVLTNRTDFMEYSEKTLTGWPSAENPYAGAGNIDWADALAIVLNVHLK